jgi:hypothetical protein
VDELIERRCRVELIDEAIESVDVDEMSYIEGVVGEFGDEAFVVIQKSKTVVIYLYDVTEDGIAVIRET